jgi:2-polyprenyl-3-methyl-5-hydroxy-6-metoxy-1,4-benzoquinol methylase
MVQVEDKKNSSLGTFENGNAFEASLFRYNGCSLKSRGDILNSSDDVRIPIRNGIARFTPDISYSSGNFGLLREEFAELQLDSCNGTTDRLNTILYRTKWPREYFKDKLILECGCGVGPDTEILLSLGARVVAVDLAGLDIAKKNLSKHENRNNALLVQASITDLPFDKKTFDIVFCHRVLQHTPDAEATLAHILQFVKDKGAVFVHSYSDHPYQRLRWKYFLRPITATMSSKLLFKIIRSGAPFFYGLTTMICKYKWGRDLAYRFIPFCNHRYHPPFKDKSDKFIMSYGIHDTFDALSPKYDRPIRKKAMNDIAEKYLKRPFEVVSGRTLTVLRTKL